jgi:hypothetical protein
MKSRGREKNPVDEAAGDRTSFATVALETS